jgi:hypothetical protein
MPGFDGTGPEGRGPRTGRGLGKCNPDNTNPNTDTAENDDFPPYGRGRGYGRGNGRGPAGRGRGRGFGFGRGGRW